MSENAFAELETTSRIAKRAQYEAFEFRLASDGVVVRNESHANPADHEYRVTIANGLPTACECPFDRKRTTACKHRVAVAIRTPVLDAARSRLRTDGGGNTSRFPEFDDEKCDCEDLPDEFPCWHCVSIGRRSLP